jgi:hypothetical protein
MTPTQQRFVELERKKEEVKKYYEDLQATIQQLVQENGLNSYFADDQGVVYKIAECEGRYVKFDKYGYCRTKRPGEKQGSLSLKEAREHGFTVD